MPTKNGCIYNVEIVNGNKVFDVLVDANYSIVFSTTEEQVDRDDNPVNTDRFLTEFTSD
jgi:hypothetical protein